MADSTENRGLQSTGASKKSSSRESKSTKPVEGGFGLEGLSWDRGGRGAVQMSPKVSLFDGEKTSGVLESVVDCFTVSVARRFGLSERKSMRASATLRAILLKKCVYAFVGFFF